MLYFSVICIYSTEIDNQSNIPLFEQPFQSLATITLDLVRIHS